MLPDRDALENRRRKLESELDRAVAELRRMGAERIILIGSMSMDTPSPYGDIDLVAVMRTNERFLDRLKKAYGNIQPSVAMDLLIYTPEEFEDMRETSPFLVQALKGGKVLYAA